MKINQVTMLTKIPIGLNARGQESIISSYLQGSAAVAACGMPPQQSGPTHVQIGCSVKENADAEFLRISLAPAPNEEMSQVLDEELVRRVQRGDKTAFDSLVRKYQHKITQLINRYVKDPDEALDVAQESFIKAYRALASFRGESAFYTWLYRIAINTAKNHLAMRSRRPTDDDIDFEQAEQFDSGTRLRQLETPEGLVLTDELAAVIQSALNDLPEELRAAITLREFDGLSYEEIASVMDCPVGTVRSRIFRAREAIDNRLKTILG